MNERKNLAPTAEPKRETKETMIATQPNKEELVIKEKVNLPEKYFNSGTLPIVLDTGKEIAPGGDIPAISDFDKAKFALCGALGKKK